MEQKTKNKKKGVFIGSAVVLSVAVAVALVFTTPMLVNAAMRSFASPAEYYRYIEERAAKETISDLGEWYEKGIEKYFGSDNVKEEAEVVFEIGDGLRELLASLTEAEFPEADTVSFLYEAVSEANGSKGAMESVFKIDDTEVIHSDLMYDAEEETIYTRIPELTEDVLAIEAFDVLGAVNEGTTDYEAKLMQICESLPEKKQAEKLVRRYVELALDCIETVEVGEGTVEAGDVDGEYTEIVVTLDGETLQKIAETVLEELQEDEEVEQLVKEISLASGSTDADESYEQFLEEAEELLSQVEEYGESEEAGIEMTLWVDNQGDVVGRRFVFADGTEFFYAVLVDGKEIGCEVSVKTYGIKISLEGEGKRKRELFSGTFKLKGLGFSVAEFEVTDFDLQQFRKGYINGTVKISPVGTLRSSLKELAVNGDTTFEDAAVILTVDNNKKQTAFSLVMENDEQPFASLSVVSKSGKGGSVELPDKKDVTVFSNEEEFNEWFETANTETIFDRLEQAGVSREWLEEVREKLTEEEEPQYEW
ncbi:MAG: hypothetical protein IJW37_03730 [Lachnospiraceae bacterium]|nr:hypothetical protein [Lachnospiraceae bacterium]